MHAIDSMLWLSITDNNQLLVQRACDAMRACLRTSGAIILERKSVQKGGHITCDAACRPQLSVIRLRVFIRMVVEAGDLYGTTTFSVQWYTLTSSDGTASSDFEFSL